MVGPVAGADEAAEEGMILVTATILVLKMSLDVVLEMVAICDFWMGGSKKIGPQEIQFK